ncbi:hypothetical protein ACLMJK_007267 [Lecanora helva]
MFSPDTAVPASVSGRNPRRRQRNGSEDSIAIRHNPKRIRRSILGAETFRPPDDLPQQNGHVGHVTAEPVLNGYVREPGSQRHSSADTTSLAIRHWGVKKADRDRRSVKHDSGVELTRNDNYVITQSPTTPDILQDYHKSGKWHGEISSQIGHAVAMTQTEAIIWRHVQGNAPADNTKPTRVKLLHPSNNPRHPLPLGILIPTSAEPGILIVMPISGKITYWETISSAASVDANRQKQQSIQGVVSGLMSGESITKITESEPRGFVLTMSTGRLAHLIISDPQGKPSVNVQFLRDNGASSGGVFGSLRSVFSGAGWKKDVAAVRAGHSYQRGQRYIVAATTTGTFQIWDLNWNGTHSLIHDFDAKADLVKALTESTGLASQYEEHFELLDFTLLRGADSGNAVAKTRQSGDCSLMALTVLRGTDSAKYALIGVSMVNGSVTRDIVYPISCYMSSGPTDSEFRPQVIVPETAKTAFVIFERSLVLVSLAEVEESPDSQLQMEAHTLPEPFQDAVDFRKTKPYRVVGCASEQYNKNHTQASCVVMVYGFGLIRIAALPLKDGQSTLERANVTAKTKLEQAVFFGNLQQDLIDFTPRPEVQFSSAEIQDAALSVSRSIMDSTSAYISVLTPSMDQQLQRRSIALSDLNKHLRQHYDLELNRPTRWKLLWDAEKMASAKAIWRCYNVAITHLREGSEDKNLLAELIEAMSEKIKNENQPDRYETDGVRHWFIHDVWRLQNILPWAQYMVELLFQESVEDHKKLDLATQARLVSEANDIQLAGLETAFAFREANVTLYGLENESMRDGVLQKGYEKLPEFWTSTKNIVERVKTLVDVSRELTKLSDNEEDETPPSVELFMKLAAENPRQVQICCQTYIERFRWLKSRKDPESRAAGERLKDAHFQVRQDLFERLSEVGQPNAGIQLAEKYHDMKALVEIIDQELETVGDDYLTEYHERVTSYFTRFGSAWANAYFQKHIVGGDAITILMNNANFKQQLTDFLRSYPSYAKLGWINEVVTERNYLTSSDTLKEAEGQETNLWSKKIGLSLSKLSLMAAISKGQIKDEEAKSTVPGIDEKMGLYQIQEGLYEHIKPTVKGTIDAVAETDFAMEIYGTRCVGSRPILRKTLQQHIEKLLATEALSLEGLIDVLTLIDDDHIHADQGSVLDSRFFSAFQVLELGNVHDLDPGHKDLLEKIIWRRCMIQDNWEDINRTELKDDTQVQVKTGATSLFKTLKDGYRSRLWNIHIPPPPSSLTDAGTTIDSLKTASHFSKMADNKLELLAHDFEAEADLLESYIEKGRLDEWWKGVVEAAKAAARAEADQAGEEALRKQNAMKAFNRRLTDKDKGKSKKDGGVQLDEQGDVVMAS